MKASVTDTIRRARELLADRSRWLSGRWYAVTADGVPCSPRDPRAERFDMLGALMAVVGEELDTEAGQLHLTECEALLRSVVAQPQRPTRPAPTHSVTIKGQIFDAWRNGAGEVSTVPPPIPDLLVHLNDAHGHQALLETFDRALAATRSAVPLAARIRPAALTPIRQERRAARASAGEW